MVKTIYKDAKTVVNMVTRQNGELMYTCTYILDDEGFVEESVTVYADGSVSRYYEEDT